MKTAKKIFISSGLGILAVTGAAVGIFGATLGMCALCLLGAG